MPSTKITVPAAQYADYDDCLTAANDLQGWDLAPRWVDDQRDEIELTVPAQ